jgi:hypothetical protein
MCVISWGDGVVEKRVGSFTCVPQLVLVALLGLPVETRVKKNRRRSGEIMILFFHHCFLATMHHLPP